MTPANGLAEALTPRIVTAAGAGALVVGLTGSQGSGKSTLAARLPPLLAARNLRAAVLSLDDLYLPKAERQRLAREVHPLLATRGVPGTHEVALGRPDPRQPRPRRRDTDPALRQGRRRPAAASRVDALRRSGRRDRLRRLVRRRPPAAA